MEQKGRSWSIAMTFNFAYIVLRMKRTVPPTHMLYFRVKTVFIFLTTRKIQGHVLRYSMIMLTKIRLCPQGNSPRGVFWSSWTFLWIVLPKNRCVRSIHGGQGWPLDLLLYERYLSLRIDAQKSHKIIPAYNCRRAVQLLLDDPAAPPHELESI